MSSHRKRPDRSTFAQRRAQAIHTVAAEILRDPEALPEDIASAEQALTGAPLNVHALSFDEMEDYLDLQARLTGGPRRQKATWQHCSECGCVGVDAATCPKCEYKREHGAAWSLTSSPTRPDQD